MELAVVPAVGPVPVKMPPAKGSAPSKLLLQRQTLLLLGTATARVALLCKLCTVSLAVMMFWPSTKSSTLVDAGSVTVKVSWSLLTATTALLTLNAASSCARVMPDMSWVEV